MHPTLRQVVLMRPTSGGTPTPAPTAPGYIPSIATAPYAAYGAQRVISGYAGPLYRVRSASGATLDVSAQTGGDYPDLAAINTWAAANGGTPLTVPVLYDQTGNARHMTQATVANQPSLDTSLPTGYAAPILFDGYGRSTNAFLVLVTKMLSVGGLSLDLIANSVFMTAMSKVSVNSEAFFTGSTEDGLTAVEEMFIQSGQVGFRSAATSETTNNGAARASIATIGVTCSATTTNIYSKGAIRSVGHTRATTAIPRLTVGTTIFGGTAFNGMLKLFGLVAYPAALSSATDGPTLVTGMNTAFSVPPAYDYTLVLAGDSIQEGSGGALLRNMANQLIPSLTQRVEVFNCGIHGQTMATEYAARTKFASTYTAGRPNVIFVQDGTNDLGASTAGSNLYTNTTTPYVAYLKGLGYYVVVCTILPRTGSASWTGAMETERLAYNALVVANSAGADRILDLTLNPTMGPTSACANTALYGDALHPTALGYAYLAGAPSGTYSNNYTYYYALSQALGATP